jgi:ribosome-binding ATPase YchF (GTP1/OBG family)
MLSIALAGKPNAGKSTFYKAATESDVDVGNYPFTTIDPNRGMSYVRTECPCLDRDERCDSEHCRDGKRYVPVELLDVAGLVPGAHEGRAWATSSSTNSPTPTSSSTSSTPPAGPTRKANPSR